MFVISDFEKPDSATFLKIVQTVYHNGLKKLDFKRKI